MPEPADLLDPEIAGSLGMLAGLRVDDATLADFRQGFADWVLPVSDDVVRTDVVVPGEDGDADIEVRVHRAVGDDRVLPCIYSIHGGGYVLGTNTMDDAHFDRWCPSLGVVGVSVEYRMAPEHPWPTPLEDCSRGLQWTVDHADELGIDPDRIGIAGVSAGGGLAAALALHERDLGGVPIRFQLLDCPMLDDRQTTSSSQLDGLAVWSRESNTFAWRAYLGDRYGTDDVPHTAAPARATDLSGLPPAFVSVGTVDSFRDEDADYAVRLNQAGVPTELHLYPGACHGYQQAVDSAVARQARQDTDRWLTRQLEALTP